MDYPIVKNCHGSQITTQFDQINQQFDTKYTTLAINCESCHGPAKKHVQLMQTENSAALEDIGLNSLATLGEDASLMVCFRCHSVKDAIAPDYIDGKDFETHYSLKLPMLATEVFTSDGKVQSFAYQQNHLFSDCYINGRMTCVDCHAPHKMNYRDNFGKKLSSPFDDGQCTGCHTGMAKNPMRHTKHPMNTEGARCVSCHMPYLQEKGIGSDIPYARSDHTIAIPRPAFDASIGIQSACQKCHTDRSVLN